MAATPAPAVAVTVAVGNPKQYPVARPPGREHIPLYPTGFSVIRIIQLVLALLILGLAAYGISTTQSLANVSFDGDSLILAVVGIDRPIPEKRL